jgi:hypothetical protein
LKAKLSDLVGRQEGIDGKRCHESIALDKDIVEMAEVLLNFNNICNESIEVYLARKKEQTTF